MKFLLFFYFSKKKKNNQIHQIFNFIIFLFIFRFLGIFFPSFHTKATIIKEKVYQVIHENDKQIKNEKNVGHENKSKEKRGPIPIVQIMSRDTKSHRKNVKVCKFTWVLECSLWNVRWILQIKCFFLRFRRKSLEYPLPVKII